MFEYTEAQRTLIDAEIDRIPYKTFEHLCLKCSQGICDMQEIPPDQTTGEYYVCSSCPFHSEDNLLSYAPELIVHTPLGKATQILMHAGDMQTNLGCFETCKRLAGEIINILKDLKEI